MNTNPTMNTPSYSLVFTDNAAKKVRALIVEENNPALNLRVFITGGGCSGFQYHFTFDDTINDDDKVTKKTFLDENNSTVTVKLLVDPMSFQYLKNAEIDYREDMSGAQFVIRNPNVKTTCGCGSSFSTE